MGLMRNKKGRISIDKLKLTNPQKDAVQKLMSAQKNKFKKLLHQAHERIHVIGDHCRNFEFWFNVMGHYEYVSPACERITGYTREEFLNGEILLEIIVHDDDKERFRGDKKSAFSGSSGKDVEYRYVTKHGEERFMTISWVPVTTRWGKLIGVRGSIMDITEIKLYKKLVDTLKIGVKPDGQDVSPPAVFSLSESGIITSWSLTAEEMLGYQTETIVGSDLRALLNDRGQVDALQGKLDRTVKYGSVEYQSWLKRSDSQTILGRIQLASVTTGEQDNHIVSTIHLLATSEETDG